MGTSKGWETRRRRQAEQAKEWDNALFAAGVAEERKRIRLELLKLVYSGSDGLWRAEIDRICPADGEPVADERTADRISEKLLERCEALVRAQLHLNQGLRRPDDEAAALLGDLLADLRRALGKEG